jgi:hypothetical protein
VSKFLPQLKETALVASLGRETKMVRVLNTRAMIHQAALDHWLRERQQYETALYRRQTRFELCDASRANRTSRGDQLLVRLYAMFNHGLGRKWSPTQQKIFKAFVDSALPKIYGYRRLPFMCKFSELTHERYEWEEVKTRVMRERGLLKEQPWALVNMARRNGKTFVTAGTAAAFILTIPGLSIAIFSTGIRASQLLRGTLNDMIDSAFDLGTHARRESYRVVQKNKEMYVFDHPEGGQRRQEPLGFAHWARQITVGEY